MDMKLGCDIKEFAQNSVNIVAFRHHRRILVKLLLNGNIVAHLYSNGIYTIFTLIGRIVQLLFRMDIGQRLMFSLYTATEGDGVGHFVVKLHKVGIFPVDQPLIEIAIRQSDLRGLTDVARLKQFLVIHLIID